MSETMNIFLVEDNDLDAEILERAFRKSGTSVSITRAKDGVEALDMLMQDTGARVLPKPYIILLDINMPRMNGHELLAHIRANTEIDNVPVFVFTTSASKTDIDRAYSNRINGYIVKPDGLSGLNDVLELLDRFWKVCELPARVSARRLPGAAMAV